MFEKIMKTVSTPTKESVIGGLAIAATCYCVYSGGKKAIEIARNAGNKVFPRKDVEEADAVVIDDEPETK